GRPGHSVGRRVPVAGPVRQPWDQGLPAVATEGKAMNRLEKKCVIASASMHGLLLVIVLVGPAFLSSRKDAADMPLLDVIPSRLVDAALSGGGNPNAKPPPPAERIQQPHPAVQPAPQPPRVEREPAPKPVAVKPEPTKPEPVRAEIKPTKDVTDKAPPKREVKVNRQVVKLNQEDAADKAKAQEA